MISDSVRMQAESQRLMVAVAGLVTKAARASETGQNNARPGLSAWNGDLGRFFV